MAIRSFLAFELSPPIKDVLKELLKDLTPRLQGIRWVPLENIHLTVLFLGDVEETQLEPISQAIEGVSQKYGRFEMKITGVGIFGGIRRPRVLWVGMNGDVERMGYFKNSLEKVLSKFGIKLEDRPFRPHLTLGRFREDFRQTEELQKVLEDYKTLGDRDQVFEEVCLFKSQLTPRGSIYTRLSNFRLSGSK